MRRFFVRLGVAALVALVAALGLLLALLPSARQPQPLSTFSFEPDGLRALYLVADALGFPVRVWRDVPERLPPAGTLLVLARVPDQPPDLPPALASGEGFAFRQSRALVHYGRFVEQGGTLLLFGELANELPTVAETLGLSDWNPLAYGPTLFPRGPFVLPDGTELSFRDGPLGVFDRAERTILADAAGRTVGAVQRCGAGRVAWLTLPLERFDNEHLEAERDYALVFTRVLEALGPFERVAFDEYALDGWQPETVPELAFGPKLAGLSLHALVLLLVLAWRAAWPGPFPRDPRPTLPASALARARGSARLLARAGRHDLLADSLRAAWLARAVHGSARTESEAGFGALAGGDERLRERLVELESRTVTDAGELAALARDLDQAEDALAAARRQALT